MGDGGKFRKKKQRNMKNKRPKKERPKKDRRKGERREGDRRKEETEKQTGKKHEVNEENEEKKEKKKKEEKKEIDGHMFFDGENLLHMMMDRRQRICYTKLPIVLAAEVERRYGKPVAEMKLSFYTVERKDRRLTDSKSRFLDLIERAGYKIEPISERLKSAEGGRRLHCPADSAIGFDMCDSLWKNDPDVIVCVSGDGDFIPVYKRLHKRGKKVYVLSDRRRLHEELLTCGFVEVIFIEDIMSDIELSNGIQF